MSTCPIIIIYGGRSVSSKHRNKFNTTLIGNGRGFYLQKQCLTLLDFIAQEIARCEAIYLKLTLMRGLFYCTKFNE
nr:MAG TPA: hypothetical protein [Bacteriophage sp.]